MSPKWVAGAEVLEPSLLPTGQEATVRSGGGTPPRRSDVERELSKQCLSCCPKRPPQSCFECHMSGRQLSEATAATPVGMWPFPQPSDVAGGSTPAFSDKGSLIHTDAQSFLGFVFARRVQGYVSLAPTM